MNVDALFSELALWEIRALFLGMEILALFVGVVAVGPMPTPYFLLFLSVIGCHFRFSLSDVVLMLTQVNDRRTRIQLNLFKLLLLLRCFLKALVDFLAYLFALEPLFFLD